MTVIRLHLHTTASDGRCTPEELVGRAHAAGIRVMSVTDHDTRAGELKSSTAISMIAQPPTCRIRARAPQRSSP